ncbi:hypothetical protein DQ04_00051020 [Trypanosoma grayi]|uniref:hypothetical protein n=1 Tax=Trypanosoma grayi TaxID=71804 RepID=UPI0004F3FFE8|nr:hypothetical protein DQ04_00051020 [Trypanosoma grayi]KEG15507.1 hypothetical protein DQ04_00051020 [Trypanosoma grayi]
MQSLTIDQVIAWLNGHRCPATAVELCRELALCGEIPPGRLASLEHEAVAASDADGSNTDAALEQTVVDVLVAYKRQKGIAAVARAAEMALGQIPQAEGPVEKEPSVPAVSNQVLQGKPQQAEVELNKVLAVLAERLPTLVRVVDPMQKDVLIPLICAAATASVNKAERAAARLLLLTLYTRPNREHRVAVAEAWAKTMQHAPVSVRQNDIVPELFNLANAKTTERRILALKCIEYVAPFLGGGTALRKSICEGLLWPLCEDESRTVRCHVVQSLVGIWPIIPEDVSGDDSSSNSEDVSSGTEECLALYMELIMHLVLHDTSSSVQRHALQSLRGSLFSKRVPCRVLLVRIVPLLLSFIERELAATDCGDSLVQATPAPTNVAAAAVVVKKREVVEVAAAKNTLLLASLIADALRYACQVVADDEGLAPTVFDAYLHVVLPSAHTLVLTCREHDALDTSICAVASALAIMVPALQMPHWKCVRSLLEMFVDGREVPSGAVDVPCGSGWRRRELCFFFAFLTCVVGVKSNAVTDATGVLSAISDEAAALMRENVTGQRTVKEEVEAKMTRVAEFAPAADVDDASLRLEACASSLACLITCVEVSQGNAAAVSTVLWSLTESADEQQRMLAVALIVRLSGLPKDDQVRALYMWPPLLLLMNDSAYAVKEAAVKAAVTMVTFISTPLEQEKVLKAALATVEAAGCPSSLSVALLQHWSSLMREMPAEPRENFLYPQLSMMIGQLSEALDRREGKSGTTIAMVAGGGPIPGAGRKATEDTLQAVLAILAAIPHCAVVTPQLVKKYLLPGIQLLASVPSLPPSSRSQLLSIAKEYNTLLGSSKGLQSTSGLFGRMREELKKRF